MFKAITIFSIGAAIASFSLAFLVQGYVLNYSLAAIAIGTVAMFYSLFAAAKS